MLKISVSGVRGIVPESLTPDICLDFAKAFGSYLNSGSVVIGTDTRTSSEFIKGIILQGLLSCGCKIIDLGIATTPTVGVAVRHLKVDGGIIVTASHNPEPWNGIKFIKDDGIFLNTLQAKKLLDIYYSKKFLVQSGGSAITYNKANHDHIEKILESINVALIKKSKFKVAIDCVNGAGSVITPLLLKKLGCQIIAINSYPKAPFPRGAEPTPENLKELSKVVKTEHADIGFAQDPDADRLAIITEDGEAISEEYTVVLCTKHILSKTASSRKLVVVNLSTTSAIDDVAKQFKAIVMRTKIGEVYVAEEVKKEKANIGGEGNGGVIFPKVGFNRDSLSAIAIILELLAKEKKKLSEILSKMPKYFLVKKKIECTSSDYATDFLEKSKERFKNETLDLTEGLKVLRKDGWIHLRPSNTEPIIRIFAEAKSQQIAEEFIKEVLS